MLTTEVERLTVIIRERQTEIESQRKKIYILEEDLTKKRSNSSEIEEKIVMLT